VKQKIYFTLLILVLIMGPTGLSRSYAQVQTRLLRNNDVLQMVADGMKSSDIITKIFTSGCNFDIFPPVLRDLRRRGVPETVLVAMNIAPTGPPLKPAEVAKLSLTTPISLLSGTVIEVESAEAVSSGKVTVGSPINFFVTKRIFVNDVLAIERGALARGHVTNVKKAAGLGRAGMLAWEMDYVVAVDGTHIPLHVIGKSSGKNRSAAIAGGAAATAALIFPYSSPVALIWGLKKGDEAVLRGNRVFNATVAAEAQIAGLQPRPGGAIYHDMDTVKAAAAPPKNTQFEKGSFRPKSIHSNQ